MKVCLSLSLTGNGCSGGWVSGNWYVNKKKTASLVFTSQAHVGGSVRSFVDHFSPPLAHSSSGTHARAGSDYSSICSSLPFFSLSRSLALRQPLKRKMLLKHKVWEARRRLFLHPGLCCLRPSDAWSVIQEEPGPSSQSLWGGARGGDCQLMMMYFFYLSNQQICR